MIFPFIFKCNVKTNISIYAGPNGEVRQVLGDFTISNLLELEGGKVIVGTDENGVPNERSASILGQHLGQIAEKPSLAPLHIQRWDNALFKTHKEQIIKDVEVNLSYQCKKLLPCFIHTLTLTFPLYRKSLTSLAQLDSSQGILVPGIT